MAMPVTVEHILKEGAKYLRKHSVPEAVTVCEILTAHVLGYPRLKLLERKAELPTEEQLVVLRAGLKRLTAGEPIQYVLGTWEFRDLTLKTDSRALIPRPETEQLVDWALTSPIWQRENPTVIDVGTGTGCIILSLAHAKTNGTFIGIDISENTLTLARENAQQCGLSQRVSFRQGDGCGAFQPGSVDLIVSNPPYIASKVVDGLERHILEHEPRLALDGGVDGLDIIRSITLAAVMVLRAGGEIYFEIGHDQGRPVARLLEQSGFRDVEIRRDYSRRIRFARGVLGV